ncbi:MAG: FAD-dependent oxidoreductase [Anaerolineae bacterium]|nr:FAD-dependent oxidoreductase [Anaerolineae bacterium]
MTDVLIVGAGLCGLMAAQVLTQQGLQITLVDKGRSVGGRLATRRIGAGLADHGAQFFTVRSPEFQTHVDEWLAAGLVYQWSSGFSDGTETSLAFDGHPRYAVRGGMNALAKQLASKLQERATIHLDTRLMTITQSPEGWEAEDEKQNRYNARAVLLTPPVPQSLALLKADLAATDRTALERIEYAPCLAGLFRVQGIVKLPEPGALQRPNDPIRWIADNQRKGISPGAAIITVHAGPDYSRQMWDALDSVILPVFQEALQPYLESPILEAQIKRWRYALPTVLHPERYLLAEGLPPLALAGDAFGEARVEGAVLSGLTVGKQLANHF